MTRTHAMIATLGLMGTLALPNGAEAASWRSFGAPAQHTDGIGTKTDDDTAAFNLHCLPGNNLVMAQLRKGPAPGHTTLILLIDGNAVARHPADVTSVAGVSWIEFGGKDTTDADIAHWLHDIASATSDIAISAGGHAAHLPLDGAARAATTALSYCKFP